MGFIDHDQGDRAGGHERSEPAVEGLGDAVGLKSSSSVSKHLSALEDKGFLKRGSYRVSRSGALSPAPISATLVIQDGKARIQEFRSIPDWWDKNKDLMIKHFEAMGEMHYQRT